MRFAVVMTVVHCRHRRGFDFQLDGLRFGVFKFQGNGNLVALFQLFFKPINIT